MKVTRIVLPLREPLTTAKGTVTERRGVVVTGNLPGAIISAAEATPHPDLSSTDPEALYRSLVDEGAVRVPETAAALGWLQLDSAARRQGLPAAALLADRPLTHVALNGLMGLDAGADAAVAQTTRGHHTIKIKVGSDIDSEMRRLEAIRTAVGPDVRLRLDASGSWVPAVAVDALERFQGMDLEYVEDPLDPGADWSVFAGCDVPLAVDANEPRPEVLDVASVVVMKPAMLSPDGAMTAAARIRDHGADVVVTSLIDGAIGVGAALQFAAAVRTQLACGLATSSLLALDVADPPPIRDGSMSLDRPGVGVVLDPRRLDQLSVRSFSNRSNG